MNLKRITAALVACCCMVTATATAYADANLDNIIGAAQAAQGRYYYTGSEWGWVVEVYIATTDDGKLDDSRSLLDSSHAAYLGRAAFVTMSPDTTSRFPGMQRPVAISINGGDTVSLTNAVAWVDGCASMGFPDPTVTGAATMKELFTVDGPALTASWAAIKTQNGGDSGIHQKIASVVSSEIRDKILNSGDPGIAFPGASGCPVEYAFVLTPLEYFRINPNVPSTIINWNENYWMGANEGAVFNRASKRAAQMLLDRLPVEMGQFQGTAAYAQAETLLTNLAVNGEQSKIQ